MILFIGFTSATWVRIPSLDTTNGYYSCGAGSGSTSNVADLAACLTICSGTVA